MHGLVYYGPGDIRWEAIPDPTPGRGEVLVEIKAVGICGSDVEGYLGKTGRRIPPLIMGHEMSGRVIEVGRGVDSRWLGEKVVIFPVIPCNNCQYCREGLTNACKERKLLGTFSNNGGMAERIVVPEELLLSLDDGISYELGALVEPLSVALRAVRKVIQVKHDTVAILGCGAIGLLALQWLTVLAPASRVIGLDIDDFRLKMARDMGAHEGFNSKAVDVVEVVKKETGGLGVDVCLEAVGLKETIEQSLRILRFGGTSILLGMTHRVVDIDIFHIVSQEIILEGSFNYTRQDFEFTIQQLKKGKLQPEKILSLCKPLPEGKEIFDTLCDKRLAGNLIKVVLVN